MKTKLFLGSLPSKFERKVLLDHFNKFGKIKSLKVLLKSKNQCSGCAILVCETEETRNKILNTTHKLFGKLIECHEYRRGTKLKTYNQELWQKRVYIKNVPLKFSNIDLKKVFEKQIGKVKIASLVNKKDKKGGPTKLELARIQSGFVTFYEEADAKRAIKNKYLPIDGFDLDLEVCQCYSHGNTKAATKKKKSKKENEMEVKETPKKKQTVEEEPIVSDKEDSLEYIPKEKQQVIAGEVEEEAEQPDVGDAEEQEEVEQPRRNNPLPIQDQKSEDPHPMKLEVIKRELLSEIRLNHYPSNIRLNHPGLASMLGFSRRSIPTFINGLSNTQSNLQPIQPSGGFDHLYQLFVQQYLNLLKFNPEVNGNKPQSLI
jgi:hypothetical protein